MDQDKKMCKSTARLYICVGLLLGAIVSWQITYSYFMVERDTFEKEAIERDIGSYKDGEFYFIDCRNHE